MVKKIAIIKLGALGDVVRTLSILPALKEKYPDSEITWFTKENALELIKSSPYIDKAKTFTEEQEDYDLLFNFDIDEEANKLAMKINSPEKKGFYSEDGFASAFNLPSEYYLNTLFDDELKKSNKRTYQQMMFDVAELDKNHLNDFHPIKPNKIYSEKFINENNFNKKNIIGIHLGASQRWPSKKWHKENLKEFIIKSKQKGYEIFLFAGPDEKEEQDKLISDLNQENIGIYRNNPNNSIDEFISLVDLCDSFICSDSFSLHVSLALRKPTIALFFVTSPSEVEDYGFLEKIKSPLLEEFFPEKSDQYSEELVKSISANEVLEVLENTKHQKKVVNAIIKNNQNKFLLIKRKEDSIHPNKWAFPGGIVEKGETLKEALKREIKEETNLEIIKIIRKISEYNYQRKDNTNTKGTCFFVETSNFNVEINKKELEDFKWVSLEELEKLNHIEGLDEELIKTYSK